jgi:uncharacterized membrane protein
MFWTPGQPPPQRCEEVEKPWNQVVLVPGLGREFPNLTVCGYRKLVTSPALFTLLSYGVP